jgi:outer membrane lipoprotein-sorting protein
MQKPRNIFLNRAGVTALFLLIAVVAVFSRDFVVSPAHAQAPALAQTQGVAIRSKADQADIARIEAYLNTIRTMKSRFLQISSDGDYSEGTLYFSKPGKMRLEYDDPNPNLIVSDGVNLIFFDKELGQVSYFDLDGTQAAILLADNISFSTGDVLVTRLERGPGVLRLTVAKESDPLEGNMTLIFSDRPLALKKWTVIDAQGIATNISLLGPRFGVPLGQKLFEVEVPSDDLNIK